jgi:hypothetical protein
MEILVWPILVAVLVAATVFMQVQLMSKPEKHLRRDDAVAKRIAIRIDAPTRAWIQENGYEFMAAYHFMQTQLAAWRKRGGVTDLVIYATQTKLAYDLVTYLRDDNSLTTSIGGEIGMFPLAKGAYKEGLDLHTLADLDTAHQGSLEILASRRGLRPSAAAPDFEENLLRSVHEQMDHVKSLPLWPLRGVYWFFVNRRRLRNRTVEDQIQRGWV